MAGPALTEIVRVVETDGRAWGLFPWALVRVAEFCREYPTDLDAESLVPWMKAQFASGSDQMGLWLGLDEAGVPRGHLLVAIEMRGTRRKVAFILQLESDVPLPPKIRAEALAQLDGWAKAQGASYLEAVTWHPRVMRRLGFRPYRTVVRREWTDER